MAGIQQHYGSLGDDKKPTPKMKEIFLRHRREIVEKGKTSLPFGCGKELQPNVVLASVPIEDEKEYSTFHKNWIDGHLTNCLNAINLESNIAIPIYDPLALGAKLQMDQPDLGFPALLAALAIPPPLSVQVSLLTLNVDIAKIPDMLPKAAEIIKPPLPPIPVIPVPPSIDFPSLSYPVPVLNLQDRQLALQLSVAQAFVTLVGEIANPEFLAKIATEGPNVLFQKTCETLKKSMPPPGTNDAQSDEVNKAALAATLAKPLSVTALGVIIGSAEKGLTGQLGAQEPDKVKEPLEEKPFSKDSIVIPLVRDAPNNNIARRTTPEFRRRLFEICQEMKAQYPEIQIDPDWLAVSMTIESAGTFLPNVRAGEISKKKPGGGYYQYGESHSIYKGNQGPAVGLIQFTSFQMSSNKYSMNSKLKKTYTLESIGNMTAVEQLDVVKDYFVAITQRDNGTRIKINTAYDTYIAIFLPAFIGKNTEVLADSGKNSFEKNIVQSNPGYVVNGKILRSKINGIVESLLQGAIKNGRIYCDKQEFVPGSGKYADEMLKSQP